MKSKVVYYEFAICHCKIKPGEVKRNRKKIICPKHGNAIASKCMECRRCGKHLTVSPVSSIKYCDTCKKIIKAERLKNYKMMNKEKLRLAAKAKRANLPPKKVKKYPPRKPKAEGRPYFDQSRRGSCRWGDYCVEQELKTEIEFNCYNCLRFEALELSIMEYMSGRDDLEDILLYWSTKQNYRPRIKNKKEN